MASPHPTDESCPRSALRFSDLFLAESRMLLSSDVHKERVAVTGLGPCLGVLRAHGWQLWAGRSCESWVVGEGEAEST